MRTTQRHRAALLALLAIVLSLISPTALAPVAIADPATTFAVA